MATIGDDCYFFCTSSCAKGAACPFRHVESAKTAKIICQHWEMGGCMRPMCKFRHSNFKLQVDSTEVPCYWESQPVGCTKPNCLYKHSKPRSQISPAVPVTNSVPISTATEPSVTTPITSSTTQNIVPPLVKPVVIQPAKSDESNTSPVKLALGQGSGQVPTKESVPNPEDNQKTTNQENTKQETKAVKVNVKDKSTKSKMKVKKVKVSPGKKLVKAKEDMLGVKAKQLGKKMKNPKVQKKSVRERLGAAPVQTAEPPAVESSESESDSDSDDSIENIKVMSMEEIFRQKALESMLKKRAENNTQPSQLATTPSSVIVEKKTQPVAAEAESSSSTTSSSSSEEEEETSDEKETTMKASSDSDSSSSSSDSEEEEEEDDDDEFEPDVRRVIVQEENEKVARKRAHASLQKKQISIHPPVTKGKKMSNARVPVRQNAAVSSKQAVLKKRKVNVDYDSDDIVSCRVKEPLVLNVRDRLGNSLNNKKSAVSASVQSRSERLELSSGIPKREANSPHKSKIVKVSKGNSDEEQNPLADIKIKTLEEIRQEKMRKLASQQRLENKQQSTVKQRLGLKQNDSDTKGRQILIISGSKSDDADNAGITEEQKKAKKRPWRTQKRGVDQVNIGDGGDGGRTTLLKQRQVSADIDMPEEEEQSIEESPFERLRRKALIKKKKTIEAKRLKLHASVNEEHDLRIQASPKRQVLQDFEDLAGDNDEAVEEEVVNSSNKKHKHRHKHKQDRKSKTERQIYVPPAMKSSALKEEDVTMKEAVVAPTAKVAPQKRGPHPIAAAWAAGLTLSAKGTQGKRPAVEVMPISERLGTNEKIRVVSRLNIKENSPEKKCAKIQTNEQIEQPTEVTIKSFSEIMAEKRRKRLEMQAQKSGANASTGLTPSDLLPASQSASSVSLSSMSSNSSPSKNIANKPRVPITPIVFNTDTAMSSDRLQPTVDPPLTAPPKPAPQQPDAPVFSSKSHPAITHNRESQQRVKLKSFNSAHVKNKVKLSTKRKSIEHSDTNISEDSDLSNSSNSTPSSYSVKTETSLTKPATHQKGASSNVSSSHSHNPMSTPKNHGNTHSHLPSTSAVSLVSPYEKEPDTAASVYKQPVPTETEPVKKSRPSFEDEFSFFDDVGLDDDNVISGDVEPIDDLLQDIDDLLA